jgi:hypothetical protein
MDGTGARGQRAPMLTGIASGLAVAVIVGALGWLRKTDHRDALMRSVRWVREHLCRGHEPQPRSGAILLTPYVERCRKCGARG